MKILFYTPASSGGHAEYTFELLRGLAAAPSPELELHLVTREGLAREYESTQWQIHAELPPLRPRQQFRSTAGWAVNRLAYNLRELRALKTVLRREHWDVVHFQEVSPIFQRGLLRTTRPGAKYVFTVHNVQHHRRMARGLAQAYNRLTFDAWRRFDALVYHSERLQRMAAAEMPSHDGATRVIPHGIWSVPPRPQARERDPRQVRFVFLGVLRPNKGLHLLLDAFAQVRGAALSIAGAIVDQRYFETEIAPRLARLHAAGADVTTEFAFISKPRLLEYLDAADYAVLPYSDFESQSGILMYAMACGVPVIAGDVGALGETIRLHGVGRTYAARDPHALAATLRQATVAGAASLREHVRRYAEERSWPKVAAQHAGLYRELIGTPQRAAAPAGSVANGGS